MQLLLITLKVSDDKTASEIYPSFAHFVPLLEGDGMDYSAAGSVRRFPFHVPNLNLSRI